MTDEPGEGRALTTIEGSRVGIVGGSIAGCAAAIALRRAGCEVTVYERSTSELQDRGFGIAIPVPLREELVAAGYIDADMPVHTCAERICFVRDPAVPSGQRKICHHPFQAALNNWGVLWRTLRARIPDGIYRDGSTVVELVDEADGVTVVTGTGRQRYDIVVGADGYRAMSRARVDPSATPTYADYVLWRGTYPESLLEGRTPPELERGLVWIGLPRGHGVCYLIPDPAPGRRRVNWGVYGTVPSRHRFDTPTSLPPGSVSDELFDVLLRSLGDFPPYWAEVVRRTPRPAMSVQPVYDSTISSYTAGSLLVIGDAATVTRPHTGAGATKALQDALALEHACGHSETWPQALAAYDQARRPVGNDLVALGRKLGRAQVEHPPTWARMTPEVFREWMYAGTFTIAPYES
ncbi:FAD-dependent monooxygenase [Kibdelosporangium phytohabitans]|uniref:FAD-dependent monooxygenase n=1 Tax=Kibdelosporangium phytohabitans TaxID=860235 RepID=UPI0012F7EAD3|nr:FAD-dependent monooxygenase [Kibdelosporangium phytohabitans]MBE1469568.1 2-polyprenyl-6-methoxyphenol hydroxylase-like FAD-dependent oxidoreductase [Kibdelosporangium phytohabitans]